VVGEVVFPSAAHSGIAERKSKPIRRRYVLANYCAPISAAVWTPDETTRRCVNSLRRRAAWWRIDPRQEPHTRCCIKRLIARRSEVVHRAGLLYLRHLDWIRQARQSMLPCDCWKTANRDRRARCTEATESWHDPKSNLPDDLAVSMSPCPLR